MKIAVISDIHSNFPALKAVMADLPSIDGIICCGDIVGYYPCANEVCNELRGLGVHIIRGNHDAYVTGHLTPDPTKSGIYKVEYTRSVLSEENYRWLHGLPVELRFDLDGLSLIVRHANFNDEEGYFYPDSKELGNVRLRDKEIVFFGHTHHPMDIRAGEGRIVNPGSVGQPRDWNPAASYAVIDTLIQEVEFRRVHYPVREFQDELRKMDWEPSLINILTREKTNQHADRS